MLTFLCVLGFYMFFICIMFGYDALAGSVVISIAEFRKDFGYLFEGTYVVDANWQLGFQAAFFVGKSSPRLPFHHCAIII